MEFVGSTLNVLAGIALIVLGIRNEDSTGIRTRSGKQMILLGIMVLLAAFIWGWSDFVAGLKASYGDH